MKTIIIKFISWILIKMKVCFSLNITSNGDTSVSINDIDIFCARIEPDGFILMSSWVKEADDSFGNIIRFPIERENINYK